MTVKRILEMRIPARADRLGAIRAVVKRSAVDAGCDDKLGDSIVLAVNEACMNIIQHAYGGDSEDDILLEISANDSTISFRLVDFADPVDLDKVKSRDLDDIRPGGLGIHFIREIMDDFRIGHLEEGSGNYQVMCIKIL